jgi:hypothetical protein
MRFSGAPSRLRFAARTFTGSPLSAPASRGPSCLRTSLALASGRGNVGTFDRGAGAGQDERAETVGPYRKYLLERAGGLS